MIRFIDINKETESLCKYMSIKQLKELINTLPDTICNLKIEHDNQRIAVIDLNKEGTVGGGIMYFLKQTETEKIRVALEATKDINITLPERMCRLKEFAKTVENSIEALERRERLIDAEADERFQSMVASFYQFIDSSEAEKEKFNSLVKSFLEFFNVPMA